MYNKSDFYLEEKEVESIENGWFDAPVVALTENTNERTGDGHHACLESITTFKKCLGQIDET